MKPKSCEEHSGLILAELDELLFDVERKRTKPTSGEEDSKLILAELDELMFDVEKKRRLCEPSEVVREKPILNSPKKLSCAKSPAKQSYKNTMADTIQPDPVIKDGWVEISEESGIVRQGDVFESMHDLFLTCKKPKPLTNRSYPREE